MTRLQTIVSRLLPKSRFARGVTVLASGTAAGQAIVVLASPILTRLYTPDDFGVLAVYASFLGIVTVAASLRYQLAIPLPRSDGSAANILALSLICVGVVTAVITLIVALLGGSIVAWTNTPMLKPYLWLLPVGVALGGAYQAFNYWAVRKRAFTRIASTKLQQGGGMVVTQIGLGFAHFGPLGLILGQVVGQTAGLTNLVRSAWREDRSALRRIRGDRIRWAARRYRQFPLYSTWSGLANTAGSQLPPLLFAALFSPAIAGFYMLANRVLHMPMSLLGQSIGQVFHSSAAEARRENKLDAITLQTFSGLVRIGLGPIALVAITAPELFAFVFGSEWREAGTYVQWMAPWLIMVFITSPLSNLVSVMERQKHGLIFQLSLFVVRSSAIVLGAVFGGALLAVMLFSLSGFLLWTIFSVWLLWAAGVTVLKWGRVVAGELGIMVPFGVAFWWGLNQLISVAPAQMSGLWITIYTGIAVSGVLLWRALPLFRRKERAIV